jgi:hypothetical protein
MNAKPDDLVTRFLLGELSEEERTQVEERFLADSAFFEEVLSAEDALIDRYLLGQLTGEQRERAESLFRSSDWQSREVSFTAELLASARAAAPAGGPNARAARPPAGAAHPAEEEAGGAPAVQPEDSGGLLASIAASLKNLTPRFHWAGALALVLVCLALLYWILYRYSPPRLPTVNQAAAEREGREAREKPPEEAAGRATPGGSPEVEKGKRETPEEAVVPRQPRRQESIASIILSPATLERGGGSQTVKLRTGTSKVQLQLALDEGKRYERYSVLISTFDGRKVWGRDSLDAGHITKGRITLALPSALFGYDDYKVELKGLPHGGEPVHVADYVFKVRD